MPNDQHLQPAAPPDRSTEPLLDDGGTYAARSREASAFGATAPWPCPCRDRGSYYEAFEEPADLARFWAD